MAYERARPGHADGLRIVLLSSQRGSRWATAIYAPEMGSSTAGTSHVPIHVELLRAQGRLPLRAAAPAVPRWTRKCSSAQRASPPPRRCHVDRETQYYEVVRESAAHPLRATSLGAARGRADERRVATAIEYTKDAAVQ